jgi:hypothetical protein
VHEKTVVCAVCFIRVPDYLTNIYTWEVTKITLSSFFSGKLYNGHLDCPYQLLQKENSGVFDKVCYKDLPLKL